MSIPDRQQWQAELHFDYRIFLKWTLFPLPAVPGVRRKDGLVPPVTPVFLAFPFRTMSWAIVAAVGSSCDVAALIPISSCLSRPLLEVVVEDDTNRFDSSFQLHCYCWNACVLAFHLLGNDRVDIAAAAVVGQILLGNCCSDLLCRCCVVVVAAAAGDASDHLPLVPDTCSYF